MSRNPQRCRCSTRCAAVICAIRLLDCGNGFRPLKRRAKDSASAISSGVAGRSSGRLLMVTGNSEKSVQGPAEIPGRGIDGVTTAEEPEPTAVLVLDLPIVAGSAALAIGRPPLSGDAFGSVRAPDPVPLAAPD